MPERGCGYCADDANMAYDHVRQVASDIEVGQLLQCPRCAWLYLDPMDGTTPRAVRVDEARVAFPAWSPARDIQQR
jgi:hypothetical protein